MERDKYTVKQWNDVEDLSALESGEFDLILLDLLGVGRAESADEGFGLLRHIREMSPGQIVIAYSNSDLSLKYQPFFRDADAVFHKTKTDYAEFKREIDRLLDERFSIGFYLGRIERELGDQLAAAPKAREKARVAILTGKSAGLQKYLAKRVDDSRAVDRVLTLVGIAVKVASIWTS